MSPEERCEAARLRTRKWYAENKERLKAERAANPEIAAADRKKCREYYKNNKRKEAARHRKYNAENAEKVAAAKRKYNAENAENIALYTKKYREENKAWFVKYRKEHQKDRIEYNKAWRKANPERVRVWNNRWCEANPEKVKAQGEAYRQTPAYALQLLGYPVEAKNTPGLLVLAKAKIAQLQLLRELR